MSADGTSPVQGIQPAAVPQAQSPAAAEQQPRMEFPPIQSEPVAEPVLEPAAETAMDPQSNAARDQSAQTTGPYPQMPNVQPSLRPDLSPLTNAIPIDLAALLVRDENEADITPPIPIAPKQNSPEEYRDIDTRQLEHDFLDGSGNGSPTLVAPDLLIANLRSLRGSLLREVERVNRILEALVGKPEQ